jgi:hypothetical protein
MVKKCMVTPMKHTTNLQANFSYQTFLNEETKQLNITLFKEEDEQEITLSYWEAFLLLEKLKLEFCEK